MSDIDTFYDITRAEGFSRRSFMKHGSLTASALGFNPAFVPQIAHASETKPRTPVIWVHRLERTCCSKSFILSAHPLPKDVALPMISPDDAETVMTAAGHAAEAAMMDTIETYKVQYMLAVEGNPLLKDEGMFCISGSKSFVEKLKMAAKDAKAVISWGACASKGCLQAAKPNKTQATSARKVITDKPIIKVPGCSPMAKVMAGVITHMLTFDCMPKLDWQRRPATFCGQRIHDYIVHLYCCKKTNYIRTLNECSKVISERQKALPPNHPMSSPGCSQDVQNRFKHCVESGEFALIKTGYWDNRADELPLEAGLMATTQYMAALDLPREVVKVQTIFGGKNPRPNCLVGAVPCPINLYSTGTVGALNIKRLNMGEAIANGDFTTVHDAGVRNHEQARDSSTSHETHTARKARGRTQGTVSSKLSSSLVRTSTMQRPTSKRPTKAQSTLGLRRHTDAVTRWRADHWRATSSARQKGTRASPIRSRTGGAQWACASRRSSWQWSGQRHGRLKLDIVPPRQYFFNKLAADMKNDGERIANVAKWYPGTWSKETKGMRISEASRVALVHWVKIESAGVPKYQCVLPTIWNGWPRDSHDKIGAFAASLLNTKMEHPEEPVETLRMLHSFDPRLARSTHDMSPDGDALTTVKVR